MFDMMKLMKQAATMKRDLERVKKRMADKTVEFSTGGTITVTAACDGTIRRIKIAPQSVDPSRVDALEKAMLAAVNGALGEARRVMEKEMSALTAGMDIPGLTG